MEAYTAWWEGRRAGGAAQGQRTHDKKNKVQMPQERVGVEMQRENMTMPTILLYSLEGQAEEGL